MPYILLTREHALNFLDYSWTSITKCFKSFDFEIGQSKDESNTCPVNNYIEKFLNENVHYLLSGIIYNDNISECTHRLPEKSRNFFNNSAKM